MIYLDHQATTPLDERVFAAMQPHFGAAFGNPHSTENAVGQAAEAATDAARTQVAVAIGARPDEIIFTSGATEANNLAIKGAAGFVRRHDPRSRRSKIITFATEHKCVLESVRHSGLEPVVLPVRSNGLVNLDKLRDVLDDQVLLVSAMLVNNEIGVIQPVAEIAALAAEVGAKVHCDAAQALGKLPVDVGALGVDMLSLSAHKASGPMGIGALYVRRRPRMRIEPLLHGGSQERTLRSGTLPLPLVVGMGAAAALPLSDVQDLAERLRAAIPAEAINGDVTARVPHNLNIQLPGWDGVIPPGFALSTGSACSAAELEPSYVLRALGVTPDQARRSLRVSLGRTTTTTDIDAFIERVEPWL